jgi:hypothetical protein
MEDDDSRSKWKVTTDYMNNNIYLDTPDEDDDLDEIEAFGKAIVKACQHMRKEIKDNRYEV